MAAAVRMKTPSTPYRHWLADTGWGLRRRDSATGPRIPQPLERTLRAGTRSVNKRCAPIADFGRAAPVVTPTMCVPIRAPKDWLEPQRAGGALGWKSGGVAAGRYPPRLVFVNGVRLLAGECSDQGRGVDIDVRKRIEGEVMGSTDAARLEVERFAVRSADSTPIAVWVDGQGPPLVLVRGAMSDHTTDALFIQELRGGVTTFAMDRRGRGESGDAPEYAIEREFEDVAAVVDSVAIRAGAPVTVWGHSYGADCAMGAATLSSNVGRLVLYEPGLGFASSDAVNAAIEAIELAVAAGDKERALLVALKEIVELTDEEVAFVRSSAAWPARLAAVPVLPREVRAEVGWVYQPGQFDAVTAATVLLAGADSSPAQQEVTQRAAAAIPGAQIQVLEGHAHMAHRVDPAMVAAIVLGFAKS